MIDTPSVDVDRVPLPRPTGADVIGAASPGSLFKRRNLSPLLADLARRLGSKALITNLALYPGKLELIVGYSSGDARIVQLEPDGAITEGAMFPILNAQAVWVSQLSAAVPQMLAEEIAVRYHFALSDLDRMVLITDLPGQNAGWRIVPKIPLGAMEPPATFLSLLDGTSLYEREAG